MRRAPSCWAVIPAAGVGSRMQADRPKQYLELLGCTVIEHTIARFAEHPRIAGIVIALNPADSYWKQLDIRCAKPLHVAVGGAQRCDSVLNALRLLEGHAQSTDWVLVHDAARPCVRVEDIDRLIDSLSDDPVGGILASPVRDTMKRAGADGRITRTEDRSNLWHALTPQMFRLAQLRDNLERALAAGAVITDEASAMEFCGDAPRLVEGSADNIKITRPEDLRHAALFLQAAAEGATQ